MADATTNEKLLNGSGVGYLWGQVLVQLATKYGADEVSAAITSALTNYYTKSETLSASQIQDLIDNLNAIAILNKDSVNGGVVEATTANYATVCTEYVQTNYSRAPQNLDGIIVTLTDSANDMVLYTYSAASTSWIDVSRNISMNVASATDTTAGIMKKYNALGTQTDGAITPAAVKAKTDAIDSSIGTLNTTVSGHTTSITNLQSGKANQSDLDELEGTVGTLQTTVSGLGTSKADQSDLDSLESAVNTQGQTITQQGTSITSLQNDKANKTDTFNRTTDVLTNTDIDAIIASVD